MDFMLVPTNFLLLALKLVIFGFLVGLALDRLESTLKETPYEWLLIALFSAAVSLSAALVYLELPH